MVISVCLLKNIFRENRTNITKWSKNDNELSQCPISIYFVRTFLNSFKTHPVAPHTCSDFKLK